MKKILSVMLAAVMIFSLMSPSFAASGSQSVYPIIRLGGNGEDIVDPEGNVVYDFDYDTSNLKDDIIEVCMPHLLTGIATGNFDDYYNALYEKLADIYGIAKLDENGDPIGGADISPRRYEENKANAAKKGKSTYSLYEYPFEYDWRLDPLLTADLLADYIDTILTNTGKAKVSIHCNCLGGTPVMAYLAKYGSEKLDTVCFDAVVTNGCEMISDTFSGNMNFSAEAALRFADTERWNDDLKDMMGDPLLFEFVYSTIKLLNSVGVSDKIIDIAMESVYETIGRNVTGIFVRAGMGTWPSYWGSVEPQEFETAKAVVFGKEGGELRQKYAGLIEKIDYYYNFVTLRIPEILQNTKDSGTKVCIAAKYGSQIFPYYNSYDEVGDQWVSLSNASMNATVCQIGERFTDEYIAKREAEGLGKYISVDRIVDASTCVLPDNTWFIKGADHETWASSIKDLGYMVCSGAITDINSDENFPQFLFYDKQTGQLSPLTEDNMNCEEYFNTDTGSTENMSFIEKIIKRIKICIEFLKNAFLYFSQLIKNHQQESTNA